MLYRTCFTIGLILTTQAYAQTTSQTQLVKFDPGLPQPQVDNQYYAHAHKVVVQINTEPVDDSVEHFYLKLLNNVNNYYNAIYLSSQQTPEITVIIHGDGVHMLLAAQDGSAPKLAARLDEIRNKPGIQLKLCYNTLIGKKITANQLYHIQASDLVLSGVAEIARLQGQGFAYLKL